MNKIDILLPKLLQRVIIERNVNNKRTFISVNTLQNVILIKLFRSKWDLINIYQNFDTIICSELYIITSLHNTGTVFFSISRLRF